MAHSLRSTLYVLPDLPQVDTGYVSHTDDDRGRRRKRATAPLSWIFLLTVGAAPRTALALPGPVILSLRSARGRCPSHSGWRL
jgi:hypothetical protein